MRKILFLFFEGLPTAVIDSQVLGHCARMKETLKIDFEIWSFACSKTLYESSQKRVKEAQQTSGCKVRLFKGIRPAYPLSEYLNAKIVKKKIKEFDVCFDSIHARTDYSSHVASLVSRDFIWDCRGDTLAEFNNQYKTSNNYLGKIYKRFKIKNNISNARRAKKALFVSNFLKQKHQFDKEHYVIGCMADEKIFFYDEQLRQTTRKELGLQEDEKVLIYSGGMAHYQKFPQTVDAFLELQNEWKFIVLTNNTQAALKELNRVPKERYILKNVSFNEVNAYLNAADVGIMLREEDDLNKAASPTKYAEYSMSGLYIIYSDHIGDLHLYEKEIKNRECVENLDTIDISEDKRLARSFSSTKILSKSMAHEKYMKLYEIT